MNKLLDTEENDNANGRRDREITLGASTVLGIFFGLAILCAAFFGFGYSLGSKHSTPTVAANGDPLAHSSTVKPSPAPATSPAAPNTAPAGQFVVQVAALSHQEDADLIATTLERRGYTVAIHPDPADKLLHVQIGPFATRKDADAMRQKLLADGFNAYIK